MIKRKLGKNGERVYSIGQFAKIIKRSPGTLRRWDKQSIFLAVRLPPSDKCYYTEAKLEEYKKLKEENLIGIKTCTKCKETKPRAQFSKRSQNKDGLKPHCKECVKKYRIKTRKQRHEYNDRYYKTEKGRLSKQKAVKKYTESEKFEKSQRKYLSSGKGIRNRQNVGLKRRYGIDYEDKKMMYVEQDCCCAICKEVYVIDKLVVEHDHETGLVRGLTCNRCNTLLGLAHDDIKILKSAIEYLKKSRR